jgi:hypothetical protein
MFTTDKNGISVSQHFGMNSLLSKKLTELLSLCRMYSECIANHRPAHACAFYVLLLGGNIYIHLSAAGRTLDMLPELSQGQGFFNFIPALAGITVNHLTNSLKIMVC